MMVRSGLTRAHRVILVVVAFAIGAALHGCVPVSSRMSRGSGGDSLHVPITRVLGLRIHGAGDAASPPILRLPVDGKLGGIGSDALTIEF
jgi:hypothetical protein